MSKLGHKGGVSCLCISLRRYIWVKTSEWLGTISLETTPANRFLGTDRGPKHRRLTDEDPWIGVETSVFWTSIYPQKTIGWSCFQRDCTQYICLRRCYSTISHQRSHFNVFLASSFCSSTAVISSSFSICSSMIIIASCGESWHT